MTAFLFGNAASDAQVCHMSWGDTLESQGWPECLLREHEPRLLNLEAINEVHRRLAVEDAGDLGRGL